jgi:hypothetical protein
VARPYGGAGLIGTLYRGSTRGIDPRLICGNPVGLTKTGLGIAGSRVMRIARNPQGFPEISRVQAPP